MTAAKKKRALDLKKLLTAIDRKDRSFDQNLSMEEAKEFSAYISMRWSSGVNGGLDEQMYYLRSANERANKNFFDLSRHPKLQWLLCTTVSPGIGTFNHYWVSGKKSDNKAYRFISKQFPHLNDDEIDIMIKNTTIEDLRNYARNLGWDDSEIKQEL